MAYYIDRSGALRKDDEGSDYYVSRDGAIFGEMASSVVPFTGTTTTDNVPVIGQQPILRAGPVHIEEILVDKSGVTRNNLSGLKWAFFDDHPSLGGTPTDVGTAETTDASGNLYVPIPNATAPPGTTGWLVLSSSDEVWSCVSEVTVLNF